jgi:hypothetical protein
MLHHIVVMKFKAEVSAAQIAQLEQMLDNLPNEIIDIQTYEFGRNVVASPRAYDFALVAGFPHQVALERYQAHPAHQPVVALLGEMCADICAVDFETAYAAPGGLVEPDPLDKLMPSGG